MSAPVLIAPRASDSPPKRAVCARRALNEAYDYERPSSFSRAMRLDFGNVAVLLISGTASIDEQR